MRKAVSTSAKRFESLLETVLRDQDISRAVYEQAASHVPNIGKWLADTSVAIEVSSFHQASEEVFGRDAKATRRALQAQTCFGIFR
jgi:hypothetical protein